MTINKIIWRLKEKIIEILFQKSRVFFYTFLSNIKVNAKKNQPVLANGDGIIKIGKNVNFGDIDSNGGNVQIGDRYGD